MHLVLSFQRSIVSIIQSKFSSALCIQSHSFALKNLHQRISRKSSKAPQSNQKSYSHAQHSFFLAHTLVLVCSTLPFLPRSVNFQHLNKSHKSYLHSISVSACTQKRGIEGISERLELACKAAYYTTRQLSIPGTI